MMATKKTEKPIWERIHKVDTLKGVENEALGPDAIVNLPPKKRYFVRGRIKSRRRREPTITLTNTS